MFWKRIYLQLIRHKSKYPSKRIRNNSETAPGGVISGNWTPDSVISTAVHKAVYTATLYTGPLKNLMKNWWGIRTKFIKT